MSVALPIQHRAADRTAVAVRNSDSTTLPNRRRQMYLMHEELARGRMAERREQAAAERRAVRLVAARRWQRRAEQAARRAQLARDYLG